MRLCIFVAAAILAAAYSLAADEAVFKEGQPSWTSWRGPGGTGISAEKDWVPPASLARAKPVWVYKAGAGYSAACVYGGYVFTVGKYSDEEETLVCLEASTGKKVWTYTYPSRGVDYAGSRSTPVYDSGRIYVLSVAGTAHCVDARTGKGVWKYDFAAQAGANAPSWGFSSSCLIEGDLAVFNVCQYGAALDKVSGRLAWKSPPDDAGYASPVAFTWKGKRCLAVFGSKELYAVEASTGKKIASVSWITDYNVNALDPLVIGDAIFVSSAYNRGAALFRLTDKGFSKVWENKNLLAHFSSAIHRDGYIYGSSGSPGSGSWVCLSVKDGSLAWKSRSQGVDSLIMVGDYLISVCETGKLSVLAADTSAFKELIGVKDIATRLVWTGPVFAGGKIYIRSDNGDLACIDASK